jgi:hypothetical protein
MEPKAVVKRLCPYLIFDKGEYHFCTWLESCCAWVGYAALPYDLGTIEMERGRDGKIHFCSSLNFPDRERPHRMTKEDVSKICPLRLTFEEIDARVACARELSARRRIS